MKRKNNDDDADKRRTKKFNPKSDYKLTIPETSKDKIKQPKVAEEGVLPKLHFSMLIVGSSGAGKSCLSFNIIDKFYKDAFDMVIVISPTGLSDDIQAALKLPDSRVITDMDEAEEALKTIMKVQKEKIDKDGYETAKNVLICFDDIVSNYQFMNSQTVIDAFIKNRHYKFSTILCSQYWRAIPRRIRMQSSCSIFFNCSETEMKVIAEDYEPPGVGSKKFIATLQDILSEPYQFIVIMCHSPWEEKFRKGLTEIIHFNNLSHDLKNDVMKKKESDNLVIPTKKIT